MKRKKIVITGGAGFIGSHIAEYWSNQNEDVVVLDNLRSGYKKNINGLSNVNFVEGSITNKELVEEVVTNADYVFHLAAMISVPESVINPYECVEINIIGLLNILEAAKKHSVKKIIHSSSAAVYGDNPESPKHTNMKPEPKSPYGITKLDGEYYLQMYKENFGINTTSLRYFNVFGPRQDPKSQYAAAIPIFVASALKNDDIIIYGDGEQTRDFVYVKDVVQANILAATNDSLSGVFNVGNGYSISINKLVEMVLSLTESTSKIIYKEERAGDIKHSLASIDDTKMNLKFSPQFDLLKGLEETINYFIALFKQHN
ncbi:MAG: SDR family oxidoreductase [Ignavibacteria bacterium]|nr:SDR family oxidoreductase [Ignavibacteria bacterium]MDP3829773.1 SDR family oxidoreductase [Ignavibacteriaceae bacterium]